MKNSIIDKRYMQSMAFWNKPHNRKMMKATNELLAQRDMLTQLSKKYPKDYFQNTNGEIMPLERKGFFNFLFGPTSFTMDFISDMNSEYRALKTELFSLGKPIRNSIHKSSKNS